MPLHDWKKADAGVFHDFYQGWTVGISSALNGGALPHDYYSLIQMPPVATELKIHELLSANQRLDESGFPSEVTSENTRQIYALKKNIIGVHRVSDDEVVAKIEIIAPGNKSSEGARRRLSLRILEELRRGIGLLLIDVIPSDVPCRNPWYSDINSELGCAFVDFPSVNQPLALSCGIVDVVQARAEVLRVGDKLPPMPLLLPSQRQITVPLEEAYEWSFSGMAKHLQQL